MIENDARLAAQYIGVADEDLIGLIRQGDSRCQDFLINKYKNLVRMKSQAYFLTGSDRDDIVQEGMIGLFKAIRDYEKSKSPSFYLFAELCITRQIFTAIKSATRKKHVPLNTYISLNNSQDSDENRRPLEEVEFLHVKSANPETIIIEKESREYIERKIGESLSRLETEVLAHYLGGKSYAEIAALTDRDVKAVDNAIQRIKRKVEGYVSETRDGGKP